MVGYRLPKNRKMNVPLNFGVISKAYLIQLLSTHFWRCPILKMTETCASEENDDVETSGLCQGLS